MATIGALLEQTYQQLENRAGYTPEEVCANGLTPAMQLLCLLDPRLHTLTSVLIFPGRLLTLDLRSVMPRTHRVLRVLLGQAATDRPADPDVSRLTPLWPTTRAQLARLHPNWITRIGMPSHWFMLGMHILCCYPRPVEDITITVVAAAVPLAARATDDQATPALDPAQHPVIADLAQWLLMIKMGSGEAERALQALQQRIEGEPLTGALKQLRSLQRGATAQPGGGTP